MLFQLKYTSEDADKTIEKFMNDELLPIVNELETLGVSVLRFRIDFLGIIYRRRLKTLYATFQDKAKQFLTLYHMYSDPDKLFADLRLDTKTDQDTIDRLRTDYENSKELVLFHMDRGFRMVDLLQKQLDRYQTSADQRLAGFLSITAITVSFISILVSWVV